MKKTMMALALVLTLTTTAFANETNVRKEVLSAFNSEFSRAAEVSWTAGENYFKASFTMNGQHLFAYYSVDGELLGLTRYISSLQLPIGLQTQLKKNHTDKWITDLFEVANSEGTSYYVTLETANEKVVLKSTNGTSWSLHKKSNKV